MPWRIRPHLGLSVSPQDRQCSPVAGETGVRTDFFLSFSLNRTERGG
jgi:hypothetical protein